MTKLQIDTFIGTEHERSFAVPGVLIDLADRFLPVQAIDKLAEKGIDVPAIAEARRLGTPYARSVQLNERGVEKTVYLTLGERG